MSPYWQVNAGALVSAVLPWPFWRKGEVSPADLLPTRHSPASLGCPPSRTGGDKPMCRRRLPGTATRAGAAMRHEKMGPASFSPFHWLGGWVDCQLIEFVCVYIYIYI